MNNKKIPSHYQVYISNDKTELYEKIVYVYKSLFPLNLWIYSL